MTRRGPLILFPADPTAGEAWRIGRSVDGKPQVHLLTVGDDAMPAGVAAAVATLGAGPVTLALPSSWCLSATVDTAGLPRQNRRSALLYRMELALPVAAEDVVADFLAHPRQPSALGVAVAVERVRPWVDALEAAGLTVVAICPAALLAVDAERPADGRIAWGHGSAVDLFAVVAGQVTAWFTLPADADDVRLYLPALPAGPARAIDVPAAVADVVGGTSASSDWATAATAAALSGRRPRLNLAGDGLAGHGRMAGTRRAVVRAGIAAAVLVACGCGAALWRAQGYQRSADAQVARQQQIFRQLFPGHAVPADVRSRLASEARAASSPTVGEAGQSSSALMVLHDLLAHLPADVRFRLTEVRVADGTVYVEGTVPTRSDADALAAAVRDGTGVPVDTPQTTQDGPRAVHFVLSGSTGTDRSGT